MIKINNNNNDTQNSQAQNFKQLIKIEADEFKRQFKFIDKEKLFMELQNYKIENNSLKEDNTKLRTRIQQTEKELLNYERLCENMNEQTPNKQKKELLLIQLKKHNKDLQQQLKEKTSQVEHFKKNTKVTKFQELECDRKAYLDETLRLRKLIEESQLQFLTMQTKYNQSLQLESEVQKLLKTNENLIAENKALNQKSQQSDDMMRQLQQLYKVNQQKQLALDKQIQDLKQQVKKLQTDKTNLKQTIKQMQEAQYQQIAKPKKEPTPRPPPLPQHLLDEIRFKLIYRGITVEQFAEMLEGLKLQAKQQNVVVKVDDLRHIFAQEPFSYTDQNKVQQILNFLAGSGNQLVENLKHLVGQYKTFMNFPTFDFEQTQNKMKAQLKQNEKKMKEYFAKQHPNKEFIAKSDVRKMLNTLALHWDEPENLFYFLQLFEKSNENLQQIPIVDTFDPFTMDEQLEQQQNPQHMRISEESDEELFDKQSQDYSLDENAAKKKSKQQQPDQDQKPNVHQEEEEHYEENQDEQQYEENQDEQHYEQEQEHNEQHNEGQNEGSKHLDHDSQEEAQYAEDDQEQQEYEQENNDHQQDNQQENQEEEHYEQDEEEHNQQDEQQYENEEFD